MGPATLDLLVFIVVVATAGGTWYVLNNHFFDLAFILIYVYAFTVVSFPYILVLVFVALVWRVVKEQKK